MLAGLHMDPVTPSVPSGPLDMSGAVAGALQRFRGVFEHVARRFRLDPADRDELLQEVRIRLWHAEERGESVATVPASYLWRTAESAAIDIFRRRRTRTRREERLSSGAYERPSLQAEPADHRADRAELYAALDAALAELAESRRVVVRMHLAGYPREEIASSLGWTEAKTRNLLYRGLDDLREALRARGIGPEGMR